MTNNADAQIAREWASKALDNDLLDEVPIEGYRAAARHILATTDPTMAEVTHDKLREQAINLRALHQSLDGLSVDRIDGVYFRALVSAIGAHADMLEAFLPTPPTMADIAWDDEVHAGLCAEHPVYGVVRMMYADGGMIDCILPGMSLLMISAKDLTPLPGTRVDLTPRRHAEGWKE